MQLPQDAIRDFQAAYLQDFGTHLSEEEAAAIGIQLLTIMQNIYNPIPNTTPSIF